MLMPLHSAGVPLEICPSGTFAFCIAVFVTFILGERHGQGLLTKPTAFNIAGVGLLIPLASTTLAIAAFSLIRWLDKGSLGVVLTFL